MEQEIKRIAKCDVCKNMLEIDQYGNSNACPNCGWLQSEESYQHPNVPGIRNIPSLNNAIKQYNNGESATLANFNDFIETYNNYGEVEFTLNNIRYSVLYDDANKKIELLNIQTNEKQLFNDIYDFKQNAKINGKLIKDLWDNVTATDFLQET